MIALRDYASLSSGMVVKVISLGMLLGRITAGPETLPGKHDQPEEWWGVEIQTKTSGCRIEWFPTRDLMKQ